MRPHEQLTSIVSDAKRTRTCLTKFFKMNCKSALGTGWLYSEFSEHYWWNASDKLWKTRKNKKIQIGRLAFVGPSEDERYYLRLLLHNVRSPKSFEDLRTVNGHINATFQQAALKLGLMEEDDAIELCLTEGCAIQMPHVIRRLFATVLIFCQPSDPLSLWTKYYDSFLEDYRYKYPTNVVRVKHLVVRSIEQLVESMGSSLKAFGLHNLVEDDGDSIHVTKDIEDALNAPIPEECLECKEKLNQAQRVAFDVIMDHVTKGKPGAFFIDGPGGTGKTFLYNALYAEIRSMNKIVLPTTTSGIAAANIPSGRIAHSRFKIPLDPSSSLPCNVPKQGSLAVLLRETTLIIWDEASMDKKENIESLDSLLRDICNLSVLFGGKLVVFGGDFRQVLPIVPRKSQREAVATSLVSSALWPQLLKFKVTENLRSKDDPAYATFLLALGNGELQKTEDVFVELPSDIVKPYCTGIDDDVHLTDVAFPEMDMFPFNSDIFTTRAILTPMNEDVDAINSILICKFPGESVVYKSYDTMIDEYCVVYPTEFLNKLCPGGMSPHELELKVNSPVIPLRNLLPATGLCNGTRLICKRFFRNLIECVITVGHNNGRHVLITRISLRPSD
ncbi:uncharacterized protein LOC110735283 [Chenopodium quinoa]|uniref:uncharacterized protein LOC110735283 n=1 Tax=Chenopodium quinoa TaxID=63459 RepID=UPI000B79773F|nr:uncharacterized protein LOC110735283 [Chenopodium quinoa]